MNNSVEMKKKEENDNILPFERPEPKLSGSDDDGGDWLTPLADDTVFLARNKQYRGYEVGQYTVLRHNAVTLNIWVLYSGQEAAMVVDPTRFCRDIEFLEIIFDPNNEEEETGDNNG